MEAGLLEIYAFLPPPLLEGFDPEKMEDFDLFLEWIAKARYIQELKEGVITRAIAKAFPE